MGKLDGRRILLTGASRGIGFETVKLFTAEGARILGVARDAAKLKALEASHPGAFKGVAGDITDKGLAPRLAREAEAHFGALDLLINNAAIQRWDAGFGAEDLDTLEKHLDANVLGVHWMIRALTPLLLKGREPRIINVSSGAGKFDALKAEPAGPSYKLSKFALNGLTLLYAGDLKGKVAVNSLDPGWLKTDLGGPNAPGEPPEGAERMLALATKPFDVSGRFFYGAEEIQF